jgi:hypothetical protein
VSAVRPNVAPVEGVSAVGRGSRSASRRSGWSRRVLLVAAAIGLIGSIAAAPGLAIAADPASDGAQTAVQRHAIEYWTEERIRDAVPRDLILEGDPDAPGEVPAGIAPAGTAAIGGAPWTAGGAILQRSGRILFTLGGTDFSCSGSIVSDAGDPAYSLVIMAAHCAHHEGLDVFATEWVFIPAWDLTPDPSSCDDTTYGCWAAQALVIHEGWANEEVLSVAAVQHDYAFAVVGSGGHGGTQLDALGAYPVRIGGVSIGDQLHAFGYPANDPYEGNELIYCLDNAGTDPVTGAWRLTCDMTGGASGGPWLYGAADPAAGSGQVASVSSYIKNPSDGGLYGPRFDSTTQVVYTAAKAAAPSGSGIDGIIVEQSPFTDIANSTFRADIEWMYAAGITSGCAPTLFCPAGTVTRGQMAAFLVRALHLSSTTTDYFTDDETSTFENDINALRAASITTGCAPSRFCPTANVTRGQMAAFLVRALELPPTTTDYFTDDETSTFENDINALRAAGVTTGCAPTLYCPTANVTREQMAGFLHRALD